MSKSLYFDIVSDEWAAGLYVLTGDDGKQSFYYHHSMSDLEDEDHNTKEVREKYYNSFGEFWADFVKNNRWFTVHPLYIHPDQRSFIKEALTKVNWQIIDDEKWREMYQRQWSKVLHASRDYYKPLGG